MTVLEVLVALFSCHRFGRGEEGFQLSSKVPIALLTAAERAHPERYVMYCPRLSASSREVLGGARSHSLFTEMLSH